MSGTGKGRTDKPLFKIMETRYGVGMDGRGWMGRGRVSSGAGPLQQFLTAPYHRRSFSLLYPVDVGGSGWVVVDGWLWVVGSDEVGEWWVSKLVVVKYTVM